MTTLTNDFYRSSNGDRWQLIRDTETGRRIVRHEPNLASGGRLPRLICRSFWTGQDRVPENLALQELLEKLGE